MRRICTEKSDLYLKKGPKPLKRIHYMDGRTDEHTKEHTLLKNIITYFK